MDPDANLKEQREIIKRMQARDTLDDALDQANDGDRLAELAQALDEWITGGGVLPFAWTTIPVAEPAPAAVLEPVALLIKHRVCEISYRCELDHQEIEEETITGYWTGEIDTWGKYTINQVDGRDPLYLFAKEIIEVQQ